MDNGLSAADVLALTNDKDNMWQNPFVYLVWIDQPILHIKVRELLGNPTVKSRTISSQASFKRRRFNDYLEREYSQVRGSADQLRKMLKIKILNGYMKKNFLMNDIV